MVKLFFGFFLGALIITISFLVYFSDKIYPGVYIGGVSMMGLNKTQANDRIDEIIKIRSQQSLILHYKDKDYNIDLSSISQANFGSELIEESYYYGRTKFYFKKSYLTLQVPITDSIKKQLSDIALEVNQPAVEAKLQFNTDKIDIVPSVNGSDFDAEAAKLLIAQHINTGQLNSYDLPLKIVEPNISTQTAELIKNSLEEIKVKPLKLVFNDQSWSFDYSTMVKLLDLEKSNDYLVSSAAFTIEEVSVGDNSYSDRQFVLNEQKLTAYIKGIASQIDQDVQEPVFKYENNKVLEFKAPVEGRRLDVKKTTELLNSLAISLKSEKETIELPVSVVPPKNQLVNDLGIKESIGQGDSRFAGSIPNRIYNVGLAASRINGILIPPGETFSFVNAVGDISAASGYKQAYVIKSGKTELDDGGGVCQVSTTLFRAVLKAGLPIVSRTAHAYRVGYYEQGFPPGLDATIFSPSVDFKFKNDTNKHILIQTEVEGVNLTINLFGTSDGRLSVLSTPVITSSTPPPAEIRQDDPTLPVGTVKQVEHAAWGARVVFKRTVTRNSVELINESFVSNYKAWPNAYLVGTKQI